MFFFLDGVCSTSLLSCFRCCGVDGFTKRFSLSCTSNYVVYPNTVLEARSGHVRRIIDFPAPFLSIQHPGHPGSNESLHLSPKYCILGPLKSLTHALVSGRSFPFDILRYFSWSHEHNALFAFRDTVGAASDSGRLSVSAAAAAAAAALAAGQSPSERAATDRANAFNQIRFFKNGRDQGVAFNGMQAGRCRSLPCSCTATHSWRWEWGAVGTEKMSGLFNKKKIGLGVFIDRGLNHLIMLYR